MPSRNNTFPLTASPFIGSGAIVATSDISIPAIASVGEGVALSAANLSRVVSVAVAEFESGVAVAMLDISIPAIVALGNVEAIPGISIAG